jgi:hypothetical protein
MSLTSHLFPRTQQRRARAANGKTSGGSSFSDFEGR